MIMVMNMVMVIVMVMIMAIVMVAACTVNATGFFKSILASENVHFLVMFGNKSRSLPYGEIQRDKNRCWASVGRRCLHSQQLCTCVRTVR